MIGNKKLSILSRIPPCPGIILEKSFILFFLFTYEKYISPKKNNRETKIDINNEKLRKKKSKENDINDEIEVPDQVFFGLIPGKILGPFNKFPKK